MLIPFVGCFNFIMVTDFLVYIFPKQLCLFVYSFGVRIVHPGMRWLIVSVPILQNLYIGSVPL